MCASADADFSASLLAVYESPPAAAGAVDVLIIICPG